ncbi:MAG: hypothetical protein ACP5RS_07415, partial [Thermoplasmata archaeon]
MIYSKYNLRALNLSLLVNQYNFYSINYSRNYQWHSYKSNITVALNYNISFISGNKKIILFKQINFRDDSTFENLNTGKKLTIYYWDFFYMNFKILR